MQINLFLRFTIDFFRVYRFSSLCVHNDNIVERSYDCVDLFMPKPMFNLWNSLLQLGYFSRLHLLAIIIILLYYNIAPISYNTNIVIF